MSALGAGQLRRGRCSLQGQWSTGTATDASDRVIYNTSNGQVWYDADGNSAVRASSSPRCKRRDARRYRHRRGRLNAAVGGQVINGTSGNDSLSGTSSNDTISGLSGNDLLVGNPGADFMRGGDGNDTLISGEGTGTTVADDSAADTLDGKKGWSMTCTTSFKAISSCRTPAASIRSLPGATGRSDQLGESHARRRRRHRSDGTGNGLDNHHQRHRGRHDLRPGRKRQAHHQRRPEHYRCTRRRGQRHHPGTRQRRRLPCRRRGGNDLLMGRGDFSPMSARLMSSFRHKSVFGDQGGLITHFAPASDTLRLDGGSMAALGASGRFSAGDPASRRMARNGAGLVRPGDLQLHNRRAVVRRQWIRRGRGSR